MNIEKIEAQRKQNEILRTRINWKINNQQFAKLNYLTYLGCMFRFDITDQAMMKKLNDFTETRCKAPRFSHGDINRDATMKKHCII